ncbi:MAG: adenylyltransferase/cytidyltransferase family protein, partial [Herminiimonas sp.]|nr:adenylyltransferase/cytidyltransferase family protein [Herminiimonas sp.]
MTSPAPFELAVLIGRFQPFHIGHAGLLEIALANAPQVIVVLGSSFHARSAKNPFTSEERAAMIAGSLSAGDRERVAFVAIRDYYEDTRWAAAVREKVQARAGGPRRTALVGHLKDSSSYYLKHFPQWDLIEAENVHDLDSTRIRRILFEAEDISVSLDVIAGLVPVAVRQYLKGWSMLKPFTALSWEHAKVAGYKASWCGAPFPPIFSTVDAVVKTSRHVLLIKRGDFPGKGLWALPGGFLDQRERLIQGAVRELIEETRIAVLMSSLSDA